MNQLTTIAALPIAGGCKSAMPPEVGVRALHIVEYWSNARPDGTYAIGVTLDDGSKHEVGSARSISNPPAAPPITVTPAIVNFCMGGVASAEMVRQAITSSERRKPGHSSK